MNSWNERFDSPLYIYGTEANQFIRSAAHYFPENAKLAAYAEGEGRNAVYLAKHGHTVTAYDLAPSALAKVHVLAKMNGVSVETKLVDLVKDQLLEDYYDGAIMVFGHFPNVSQRAVLDKMMNSIKKQGIFMFEVYEYAQLLYDTGGPKDLCWLYNAEHVLGWARHHKLKHYFTGEVERHEGAFHTGTCRVVQVIVQK